jgi:hypothetical protein
MLISDGQHFHEKKQLNGKLYLTSIIEEVKGVDTVRWKSRTLIGAIGTITLLEIVYDDLLKTVCW